MCMTSSVSPLATPRGASRLVSAEIRAELGRQGLSQAQLAARMHVGQVWLSRRIGRNPDVDLSLEDTARIARVLGVPVTQLLAGWLDPDAEDPNLAAVLARDRPGVLVPMPRRAMDDDGAATR